MVHCPLHGQVRNRSRATPLHEPKGPRSIAYGPARLSRLHPYGNQSARSRPAPSNLAAASASAAPAQGTEHVGKRLGARAAAHAHGRVRDLHHDGSFSRHRCRSRGYWRGIIRQKRDKRRNGLARGWSWQRQLAHPCQPPPIVNLLRAASMLLRQLRYYCARREALHHDAGLRLIGPAPPLLTARVKLDTARRNRLWVVRIVSVR